MSKVLNFNTAAGTAFGSATRIRVRNTENGVEIRPTNRKDSTIRFLPKGETILELRPKNKGFRVTVQDDFFEGATFLGVTPRKHGWFTVEAMEKPTVVPGQAAPAGATITDR